MGRIRGELVMRALWPNRLASVFGRAALGALVLCAASCGRLERARQCRALSAVVNPAVDQIEQTYQKGNKDAATLRDIAARYDALAARVGTLAVSDPEVKASVEEYRGALTAAAKTLRDLSAAAQKKQDKALFTGRLELERVVRREKVAVARIDAQCNAP